MLRRCCRRHRYRSPLYGVTADYRISKKCELVHTLCCGTIGFPHGGRSSAWLERQVVALKAGGSSPLDHPTHAVVWANCFMQSCGPPRLSFSACFSAVCTFISQDEIHEISRLTNRLHCPYAPLAQLVEQRTLNPQVLGSSPRGRTFLALLGEHVLLCENAHDFHMMSMGKQIEYRHALE